MALVRTLGPPAVSPSPDGELRLRWEPSSRLYLPVDAPCDGGVPRTAGRSSWAVRARGGRRTLETARVSIAPAGPPRRPAVSRRVERTAPRYALVCVVVACAGLLGLAMREAGSRRDPSFREPARGPVSDVPTPQAIRLPEAPPVAVTAPVPAPPPTLAGSSSDAPPALPSPVVCSVAWEWKPPEGPLDPASLAALVRQAADAESWNEANNLLLWIARQDLPSDALDALLRDGSSRLVVVAIDCFRVAGVLDRLLPALVSLAESSPEAGVRNAALLAAAGTDLAAVRETVLAALAGDPDAGVRSAAAISLAGDSDPEVAEALAAAYLTETDGSVIHVLASTIRRSGDPELARRILQDTERLRVEDPRSREALEIAALLLSAEESIPALARAARSDPDGRARERAVVLLAGVRDPAAAPELVELYRAESDASVRTAILVALGPLAGSEPADLLAAEAANGPDAGTRELAGQLLAARVARGRASASQ